MYFQDGSSLGDASFTPTGGASAPLPRRVETKEFFPPHFHFGYWLSAPATDGGDWNIEPFAMGNFFGEPLTGPETATTNNNMGLKGTASYTGPATGVYAVPDQGVDGQFYGNAALSAYWGIPTGSPFGNSEAWSVSGTVDGFRSLSTSSHDGYIRDWRLDLGRADMATTRTNNVASSSDIELNTGFRGGVTTGGGAWTGRFWGQDRTAPGLRQNEPAAVTGEFTGHFTNDAEKAHAAGSVAGAFAAGK